MVAASTAEAKGRRMALSSLRDTLKMGVVGAFNFNDQFDLAGIVAAANDTREPIIAMMSPNSIAQTSMEFLHDIFKFFEVRSDTPLFLQLDHGHDVDLIAASLELGAHAVMADFSHLSYDENVAMTTLVTELARGTGALVEGEVENIGTDAARPTSPTKLTDFVSRTGVDLAAPCLGTVHGFNRYPPSVDRRSIAGLCAVTATSVVAHGADFLAPSDVRDLVSAGVAKINFGPELRVAIYQATARVAADIQAECPDHRYLTKAWTAATRFSVQARLVQIGSTRI